MASGDSRMLLKGTALMSTLRAIEDLHGKSAVVAVRAALTPDSRQLLDEPLLPVRWYPVELLSGIHVAVRDLVGHGDWRASHALGMAAAKLDFGNLYRVVIRALNATTVWSRMERMWGLYNSRGKFEWIDLKRGNMHCIIRDVAGYNGGMWNAVAGRGEQVVLMTGAKTADVHVIRWTETQAEFDGVWVE
jgi:hypothetical protein